MNIKFTDLGLRPELIEGIQRLGFESPSPIQAQTIPVALSGKDIVGLSQTGSGKTAAFGLPALNQIDINRKETQVLVLCPTRELAVQVCEEINRLAAALRGLISVPVYGGAPIDRQMRALRNGAHIVVGTPGRIMDHLRRKTLRTDSIKLCILDEATSALDLNNEAVMYTAIGKIPGISYVSVGHRPSLLRFHSQRLKLFGMGQSPSFMVEEVGETAAVESLEVSLML